MPNEDNSYLWKAIDRWENEGGALGSTEQTSMPSSSILSSSQGPNARLPHVEQGFDRVLFERAEWRRSGLDVRTF